jgi:hypothetical protein
MAGLKLAAALQGGDPLDRKAPTLREFSSRFLDWVKSARLENDTRRYYRNGWRLLKATPIAGMKLDHITADDAEALRFSYSCSAVASETTLGLLARRGLSGTPGGHAIQHWHAYRRWKQAASQVRWKLLYIFSTVSTKKHDDLCHRSKATRYAQETRNFSPGANRPVLCQRSSGRSSSDVRRNVSPL